VVDVVTLDRAIWNQPPHKEEAGSPNVVGGVALGAAVAVLQNVGMEAIAQHEEEILRYAYAKLKAIRGISLYGPTDTPQEKVGVITFNVDGLHHALTAAILSVEGGIGVRNGCFCAHPYVKELLHVSPEDDRRLTAEVLSGDKSNMPGMVRASFGCYSNVADVDALVEMLGRITRGDYRGTYVQERASGAFSAAGYAPSFADYFPYAGLTGPVSQRPGSEAS
jgi:selenocysteine lyase/cysteine desulfurase